MSDMFAGRNNAYRVQIGNVNDTGTENYHDYAGTAGESHTKVLHIQSHGFSGVPAIGAHAMALALGSRRDVVALLGGEHQSFKPKGLGAGNTAFYNADGTIMKMIGKNITLDGADTWTMTIGGVVFKFSSAGLEVTGGDIKHNGKSVGSTHTHTGVQAGASKTGEPS